jgi:F-type H+-transporting ATPase subunit epsilon
MAESPFTLRLVTPQRLVSESEIVFLEAPGSEGYLGVLAHHAPLITTLRPGRLDARDPSGAMRHYAVSGGFLEVSDNRATVLADAVERPEDIDVARAERSLRRAEERLRDGYGHATLSPAGEDARAVAEVTEIDRARAQRSLERAKNRIAIARG